MAILTGVSFVEKKRGNLASGMEFKKRKFVVRKKVEESLDARNNVGFMIFLFTLQFTFTRKHS